MKTPEEWIGELSGSLDGGGYTLHVSESDIKAIQDEAFKAGLSRAMELCGETEVFHVSERIRAERDKLP